MQIQLAICGLSIALLAGCAAGRMNASVEHDGLFPTVKVATLPRQDEPEVVTEDIAVTSDDRAQEILTESLDP